MIVFDLKCKAGGHVFEAWFGSTNDFESQRERGLVQCPVCSDPDVDKAVMAPHVGPKGNQMVVREQQPVASAAPEEVKKMMAALAQVQKKILEQSDYVGDRFADEARAIHLGEQAMRSIYGKATREETESLLEDGIAVAPLPFPVITPGEEN